MINITTDEYKQKVFDFEEEKGFKYLGEKPCIIDFYADWCAPCKVLSPILKEISEEDSDVVIYKVDVDNEPDLANLHSIRSIPSLLFIPLEGTPSMHNGLMPKDEIIETMKKLF